MSRLLGVVAALLALVGCRSPRPEALGVVLVTIDTLRADRLGLYGYDRPTSPRIDALAAESTVFDVAVPTCPSTAPSVAAMLTGLHRAAHGVKHNGDVLAEDVVTLAEILRARGYRTAARVANELLDARFGFAQGFDDFAFAFAATLARPGPDGIVLAPDVVKLLDGLGAPRFLLWLHIITPHGPYRPPEQYRTLFRAADYVWPGDRELLISGSNFGRSIIPAYQGVDGQRLPADYRARYDAVIRYTDDQVGAIVDALRARGVWDRVLFVLTADHGESLGEHDFYFQHGEHAYDDCLRVPLLVRWPGGLHAGRRVGASVSLVDLTPTILDVLGEPGGRSMEGESLLPLVRGKGGDRPARARTPYGAGKTALRQGRYKFILTPAPPREELYDLVSDPRELHNLTRERAAEAGEFRRAVVEWLRDQDGRQRAPVAAPANREVLRSLGYVD